MAFPAYFVVAAYAGSLSTRDGSLALMRAPVWSESAAAAGVSVLPAPVAREESDPIFYVLFAADGFITLDKVKPTGVVVGKRMPVQAGVPLAIYCDGGEYIAWGPTS